MDTTLQSASTPEIEYPDSDGQPMAENTLQFQWIVTIEGGIDAAYRHDDNVFVAGDLFWYPVKGHPGIRTAPDILVAFGRPKGHRGSYKQWVEGNIAPQVVWEVLSPGNTTTEMAAKLEFYERYGVEEYYIYDPDHGELFGWRRSGNKLLSIASMHGWISPRLNVRFELENGELALYGPDGRRFVSYLELAAERDEVIREREAVRRQVEAAERQAEESRREAEQAQREAEQAQREAEQAQREAEQAQREAEEAQREAEQAQREAEEAQREASESAARVARLAAQLRAAGINPEP